MLISKYLFYFIILHFFRKIKTFSEYFFDFAAKIFLQTKIICPPVV
ncbi:hypothetical protein CUS_7401 [Ruminococcus albus 8]|uniref:Uncharacterized protein n=1 Tax=Ruminococcus albus 8 TaxID=246199 RepID=E9S825_RUMAL|nr:hypothetical protein CUS_7401 [Ruminococcus albus 8]